MGDGVNIAARLEGVAPPGGICLSEDAWRQVDGKIPAAFADLGEQALKNIARPVRVYRAEPTQGQATQAPVRPTLALPDKPSIAVLPFTNMSGDPEQEYFADGMVEDIITGLSRAKWLFVIARNSSFVYKGKAVDVKQVGRELGVRYVLEGSVRKAGNRVRITGQLIEAASGTHIWADRFEGGARRHLRSARPHHLKRRRRDRAGAQDSGDATGAIEANRVARCLRLFSAGSHIFPVANRCRVGRRNRVMPKGDRDRSALFFGLWFGGLLFRQSDRSRVGIECRRRTGRGNCPRSASYTIRRR